MLNQTVTPVFPDRTGGPAANLADRIEDLLAKCDLPNGVQTEVSGRLGRARDAFEAGDLAGQSKALDQVIVILREAMGVFVPATTAAQIVTMVLTDLQADVKEPGQIYLDSRGFARDYVQVTNTSSLRPDFDLFADLQDLEQRAQAFADAVTACELPDDVEQDLIEQAHGLVRAFRQEDQVAVFVGVTDLRDSLLALSGSLLTESQTNALLGLTVIFGASLIEIIVAIVVIAALIGGLTYTFKSSPAKDAFTKLTTDIDRLVNDTSVGRGNIKAIVETRTNNRSDAEKAEILDNLKKRKEDLNERKRKAGNEAKRELGRQVRLYCFAIEGFPKTADESE